jgi:AcrR family transcriptional regulator
MRHTSLRDRILETAFAIFRDKGLAALSMRKLAERVGVTTMATYRHFRNKDDLVAALVERGFSIWARYLSVTRRGRTPLNRIGRVFDRYFDFAMQQPKFFELMFLTPRKGVPQSPQSLRDPTAPPAREMLADVEACTRAGVFRKDSPAEVLLFLWAQAHGLIALYWTGRFGPNPVHFRRYYRRSLRKATNGLRLRGKSG